jgi:two-component system, chemotaxis family, chemotaxis protein CheY
MSKTIMVVDDTQAIRMTVGFTLQQEGYEVIEAGDGAQALAKLDGREINLIICDVNMPVMDGIEFLEKIRTDTTYASYRYTPIIMLTTEAGESKKREGKDLGAKAWIVKPFKPEELLDSVSKLIL